MGKTEWEVFGRGGSCNCSFVLKPDVAIASKLSISSKSSLAITDFLAKKTQLVNYRENPPFLEPPIRHSQRNHAGHHAHLCWSSPRDDQSQKSPILVVCSQLRNENSAQRGSFRQDIPADIPPKTSVRPSKCWKKQAFRNGRPTRTFIKELGSEELRADFSFPNNLISSGIVRQHLDNCQSNVADMGRSCS